MGDGYEIVKLVAAYGKVHIRLVEMEFAWCGLNVDVLGRQRADRPGTVEQATCKECQAQVAAVRLRLSQFQ